MALDTVHDLFIYELGILRDMEASGARLLDFMAHKAGDPDLVRMLRAEQQDCTRREENISSCLETLGVTPVATPSETVQGIHARFEQMVAMRPAPPMVDIFAVDTAVRFQYVGVAAHRTLLDWVILKGEARCAQCLHANMLQKQESAARFEGLSHELGIRMLEAQPA